MKKPPKKTVQAIIALIVAFALGGAAGGLVEHQRAKDDSNKKASSPTTASKSGGKTGTGKFFTNPTTAACPELVKWKTAANTGYIALLKKTPWDTTRSVLETQSADTTAALKALLPHANKVGHKGLNILLTREKDNLAALKAAKTQADYLKALTTLTKPGRTNSIKVMTTAEAACAKTS